MGIAFDDHVLLQNALPAASAKSHSSVSELISTQRQS